MEDVRDAEGMLKNIALYKARGTARRMNRQGEMVEDLPTRPKPIPPSYPALTYADLGPRSWMA